MRYLSVLAAWRICRSTRSCQAFLRSFTTLIARNFYQRSQSYRSTCSSQTHPRDLPIVISTCGTSLTPTTIAAHAQKCLMCTSLSTPTLESSKKIGLFIVFPLFTRRKSSALRSLLEMGLWIWVGSAFLKMQNTTRRDVQIFLLRWNRAF